MDEAKVLKYILAMARPGRAAGFGTITASVSALAPDAEPIVVVETSGPNTAKNINIGFALPRGAAAYRYTDDGDGNITIEEAT